MLLNREWPRTIWAYLALVSFLEFTICGLVLAAGGTTLPAPAFGLLFMFDGLAALAVAEGLHFLVRWAKLQTCHERKTMARSILDWRELF